VVLPAWEGSDTALAGSKSGSGRRKSGDLGSISAHATESHAGTTNNFPIQP
jgi:hypothetical protein